MTSLIAWAGVDSRGTTSVYLASDSRISWDAAHGWNSGRKVFACRSSPEIFGYCAEDVQFPSLFLGQLAELIDGNLLPSEDDPNQRAARIDALARAAFDTYPSSCKRSFTIIYCLRLGMNMDARFYAYTSSWSGVAWRHEALPIPTQSGPIAVFGSGSSAVEKWHQRWEATKQGGTSRAAFGAFCDSLDSNDDPRTGGAPQLVAIHRSYHARTYGIVWKGRRYLLGLPCDDAVELDHVEWRNAIFEICDGRTMVVRPDAKKHARPRGLAKFMQEGTTTGKRRR